VAWETAKRVRRKKVVETREWAIAFAEDMGTGV
jgi:hypothetical protein